MQGNNSFRYMIRILAGIYLLYLSWSLIGGLRSGETSGIVFIIGIAVFIVAGVFFILDALRNILRESRNSQTESPENETTPEGNNEEPVSEEPAADDKTDETEKKEP